VVRRVRGEVPGVRYQAGDVDGEIGEKAREAPQPSPEGADPDGGAQVEQLRMARRTSSGRALNMSGCLLWLHLRNVDCGPQHLLLTVMLISVRWIDEDGWIADGRKVTARGACKLRQ
jgi:hypothetical protein